MTNKKGFTLVEMLLAIAILVVLSGAILVSISSQREKARVTRMLSEVSSTIQPIYMCISDGGSVSDPSAGSDICDLSSNYGEWPALQSGFSYSFETSFGSDVSSDSWYINIVKSGFNEEICCNSHLTGCEKIQSSDSCSASSP